LHLAGVTVTTMTIESEANPTTPKPIVAIVGRQNVGKSTMLNRLVGKPLAIVEDMPGTTRDRVFANVTWQGRDFTMVDTGGLEPDNQSTIARGVREQIDAAIAEADLLVLVTDAKTGVTATDLEIAERLRPVNKPIILAANKADNTRLETQAVEFYELGMGEPLAVSAHHGRGIADLMDQILSQLPPPAAETKIEGMKLAIVGRPNVGKSMLLNALIGSKRVIVDDSPGTTRDATDTLFDFDGQSVLLIDTAGIRRRGRVDAGIERYSVIRALRAIERADVVLLVLDASEPVTAQDMHIAGYIQQAAKGVILIVNKWDLIIEKDTAWWDSQIRNQLKFMTYAPIVYASAKLGRGTDDILNRAQTVYRERLKRLPTSRVNEVVQQAVATHSPPRSGKKRLKVLYATQAEVNPPTFVFFVNDTKLIHFSYQRYLENRLRDAFGFAGTPLRLVFKTRSES